MFLNIFGLLGTSCYILADTFLSPERPVPDGITLLNLCLPLYNLIFAVGSMLGLGSATRFAILRAQGDERAHRYFSNALLWAWMFSNPLYAGRSLLPGCAAAMDGRRCADRGTGRELCPDLLLFTPFFMCNYITSSFVSATMGTLRWRWRLPSAAACSMWCLTTCSSSHGDGAGPVVLHWLRRYPHRQYAGVQPALLKSPNNPAAVPRALGGRLLGQSYPLGVSGLCGEMSSGVTTPPCSSFCCFGWRATWVWRPMVWWTTMRWWLRLAVFNGVARWACSRYPAPARQGPQEYYAGAGLGTATAAGPSGAAVCRCVRPTDTLVALFNQDGNMQMAQYALRGCGCILSGICLRGSTSWPPAI